MNLIDRSEPTDTQIARQAKIIDALIRRANRQGDIDRSAFSAFQAAVALQEKYAAQSRDLERAATELASLRFTQERTRQTLIEALSTMEEGLALFSDGKLEICNELFRTILPDISDRISTGLDIVEYARLMSSSRYLLRHDGPAPEALCRDTRSGLAAQGGSVTLELTNDRWYQFSLQQTSFLNVVVLLTEITSIVRRNRFEREQLIDRQADYLRAVFQNASAGMCAFSASGEIEMQNRRFRQILGVPLTVVQNGASLEGLLDYLRTRSLVADTTFLRVAVWQRELAGKGTFKTRIRHGPGRNLSVEANRLPDGGFLIELTDVTLETRATQMLEDRVRERTAELTRANCELREQYETKARVEEELRLAKERAEAAVSSKTRFLAAASHDLLQPMNAAKLLISTLREATEGGHLAGTVERLERAYASAEYLLHSLLDISRLESADPNAIASARVSLDTILDGVMADQALVAAEKDVTLRVVPTSAVVQSDPVFLWRSIQNLVVNAIQYTPPGGRVLVGCRRKRDRAILEVWDTGIGIARDDQARIFEEFTRAGDARDSAGMGLGLSIVDRTCRQFGHRVWVRSAPGRGSVFHLEMELVDIGKRGTVMPQNNPPATDDLSLDRIILVVENDEDVLFATTARLEAWGAGVLSARSTSEAMTAISDLGMPPDLIIADYQLDDDDLGTDTIGAIRARTGVHVPAIVITADRGDRLRQQGLCEDFDVLIKPVALSRLKPMIEAKLQP